jgi:hypothetical protein
MKNRCDCKNNKNKKNAFSFIHKTVANDVHQN